MFEDGLDGCTQLAFIASNQADFDHGSAFGVGVIAGFICQRLSDSCKAGVDIVASCTSASAAADAFNSILVSGVVTAPATAMAMAMAVTMTITQCS